MMRSLLTAATGMEAQQLNIDTISNNLANVNTTAFKRSRANFHDLLYQTLRAPGQSSTTGNVVPGGIQIGTGVKLSSVDKMFTEGAVQVTGNELDFMIEGDAANFPSAETTALAVALNELLQNTIQHGFRDFLAPEKPKVIIHFGSTNETFQITVTDNGRGLPETFDEKNFGLGLTIVRNLIETDLGGNVELFPKDPSGTVALIRIPQLGENSAL